MIAAVPGADRLFDLLDPCLQIAELIGHRPQGDPCFRQEPAGPKLEYAKGSVEWQKQQEEQRLAGIAAEEAKEKRRLARVAALRGKTL